MEVLQLRQLFDLWRFKRRNRDQKSHLRLTDTGRRMSRIIRRVHIYKFSLGTKGGGFQSGLEFHFLTFTLNILQYIRVSGSWNAPFLASECGTVYITLLEVNIFMDYNTISVCWSLPMTILLIFTKTAKYKDSTRKEMH